jgi:hypothetical protein
MGTAILSDTSGWTQKISMSYNLVVSHDYYLRDEMSSLVYTKFAVDNLEVRVTRARFNEVTKSPQFRIRRTTISVEPSIADNPRPADYRDSWRAQKPNPSAVDYQLMPGSTGKEFSVTGQLQIAANPSTQVQISRKSSSSRKTHGITSIINLDKSKFEETEFGGLTWEYDIKKEVELAYLPLELHSGQSVTPKSNPPSGLDTKLSTIFDIASNNGFSFPNFQNRSACRGICIGYRQCKLELKVTVPWAEDKITRFPDPEKPSCGCQLTIKHQFRGGCQNTINPEKAVSGRVSTELTVEATR